MSWSLIAIHWGNQVLGLLTLVLYSENVMQRPEAVIWWQAAAIVVGGIFFSVAIYYRKLFPMSWLVLGIVCDVATVWWLGVMSRDVVLAPARNDTVPIQEVSVQTVRH